MSSWFGFFLIVATCTASSIALSPSSYLSKIDKARLAKVFESTWPSNDVRNVHYAASGLKLLDKDIPDESAACKLAQKSVNLQDLESVYHASMLSSLLKSCSLTGVRGIESKLAESLSAESLFQLVSIMKNEKISFDVAKTRNIMDKIAKDDSSASSAAYILQIALQLSSDKKDLVKYKTDLADILRQADEADNQYIYYDKGVFTTAFVAEALVKTMDKLGEVPNGVSGEKLYKLANYLLSRKQIYQIKSAAQLLSALRAFADSNVQSPVVVFLKGSSTLTKAGEGQISVQLASVWGRPVTDSVSVKVTSAKNTDDGAVFLKDAPLSAGSDRSVHSLNFMKVNPTVGFYRISLSASSAVKKLLLPSSVELEVKVVSKISVSSMEIWVADREQHTQPAPVRLQYPAKASSQIEADSHQRLSASFQVQLADTKKPIKVHQAFIRFGHKASGKEAIFVAEADKQNVYKFNVDLSNGAKNFDYESGLYSMELIVGDALAENSLVWQLADVNLDLPSKPTKQADERDNLKPKPEIRHIFRSPDKMAPASVALAFTGLCIAPLAILLFLWAFLGVNFSGFRPSASALLFHIGLALILGLYFMYWRSLNMFETLRYLCLLGVPTFFFGNRLLRSLAAEKRADA